MIQGIEDFSLPSNNIGSLISGLFAFFIGGLIVFLIKEKFKNPPSLSGVFYLKLTTEDSAMKSYKGLSSFFVLTLINETTTKAIGEVEKTYDIEKDGNGIEYIGKDRNRGDVIVMIERRYLGKNKMNIHMKLTGDAHGLQRPTSWFVNLKRASLKTNGVFTTTAADSKGTATFQNKEFIRER